MVSYALLRGEVWGAIGAVSSAGWWFGPDIVVRV
jgi:hypothetical protein